MKTSIGAAALLWCILGVVANPAVAQKSIRTSCKAAIKGQPIACISAPRDGITLAGSSVKVVLTASGIAIAAVEQAKAGAAHYHLFLDVDVPASADAIPQAPGVTHLGSGQKEFTLENLAPGLHRLIVVLGDNAHVPVARQQSDTAYFAIARPAS